MLEALKILEKLDIVHRDIKTDNIMYDKSTNTFKLIDFGLATKIPDGNDSTSEDILNYFPNEEYDLESEDDLRTICYVIRFIKWGKKFTHGPKENFHRKLVQSLYIRIFRSNIVTF